VVTLAAQGSFNIAEYTLYGDITDIDEEWTPVPSVAKNVFFNIPKVLLNQGVINTLYVKFRDVNSNQSDVVTAQVLYDYDSNGGPILTKAIILGKNVGVTRNANITGQYIKTAINNIWFSAYVDSPKTIVSFNITSATSDFDPSFPGSYVPSPNEKPITASAAIFHTYSSVQTANIKTVKFIDTEGTKNFEVYFRDSAGVVSSTKYFTIVLDKTKPVLITANQLILADLSLFLV
jgi:hypothetical protein